MNIFGYDFEGPYRISGEIISSAAVYIIVDSHYRVVDVGQTGIEGIDLSKHIRKHCWDQNNAVQFYVADMPIEYCDREDREILKGQIRDVMNSIPCGI